MQILTQSEDVALRAAKVLHRHEDLILALAQSEHDAGFGVNANRAGLLHLAQDLERTVVNGAVPHTGSEASDGFQIMVKDSGPAVNAISNE